MSMEKTISLPKMISKQWLPLKFKAFGKRFPTSNNKHFLRMTDTDTICENYNLLLFKNQIIKNYLSMN